MLSLSLLLGLVVVVKLTRKGLPAVSWHWQALPKTFFSKRIVVVVVVVVGLGGGGEAYSKGPARGELALASFAQKHFFLKELLLSLSLLLGLAVGKHSRFCLGFQIYYCMLVPITELTSLGQQPISTTTKISNAK